MAESIFVQPSSIDSDRPMSLASSHSASSDSLVSSNASSDSDYRSCIDEMASETSPSDEFLFDEADLKELGISLETEMNEVDLQESIIPLEAEVDDYPSTVILYLTVASSPILFPSPLLPIPFIFPETADQAVQSGEQELSRLIGSSMLVVWDPQ
ncbi:MAG: hypothetical protein GY847_38920, partial [Proteobacteria bacterium]|nr:hypothetical protein [Pseudomonadota bacterium]